MQLHNITPRQEIADFLMQRTTPINLRIIPPELRFFLNTRLARFHTHIPESLNHINTIEQKKVPEEITWQSITGEIGLVRKVVEYLNPIEQVFIALTCHCLVNTFWKDNTYTAGRLTYRLELINDFNATLNQEIAQKKCFNNRMQYPCSRTSNIPLIISLISGAGTTASIYYGVKKDDTALDIISLFPGIIFMSSLYELLKTTCNFRGQNRFYDLSINQCSGNIQKKFRSIKAAFNWSDSKPFADMDGSISVQDFQTALKTQEDLISAQLAKLNSQNTDAVISITKSPMDIVINEYSNDCNIDNDPFSEEKKPMLALSS